MRFTVGESIPFVHVKFQFKNGESNADGLGFNTFYPWYHKLIGIDFLMLKCTEHHNVPVSESASMADGFIFTQDNGNIWHNQYPVAHYGQFSNTSDSLARRHLETEDAMNEEIEKGANLFEMKSLSSYLSDVARGIFELRCESEKSTASEPDYLGHMALLQGHYDDVVSKFEREFKRTVVRTERQFGGTFRGFYEFEFIECEVA